VYRIALKAGAAKSLGALPPKLRARIVAKVKAVAADPTGRHPQAKALRGKLAGLSRLRIGDWRVIYELDHQREVLLILAVKPRGRGYD
jgi:mRNA interferase RelE/StbE